jgi:hypothetical protein
MKKEDLTFADCIHCKTSSEFDRIIELFEIDNEYVIWEVYEEKTVLFPFTKQYGELDGYCREINANVIRSEDIISFETQS